MVDLEQKIEKILLNREYGILTIPQAARRIAALVPASDPGTPARRVYDAEDVRTGRNILEGALLTIIGLCLKDGVGSTSLEMENVTLDGKDAGDWNFSLTCTREAIARRASEEA